MEARRRLLLMPHGIDTTPIIDEYGVNWNRTFGGKTENPQWCITKWYDVIDSPTGILQIAGFVGNDSNQITFQYYYGNNYDWYYFDGTNPRQINNSANARRLTSITFSVEISEIDNSYAYLVQTGQIFFAGKNTPYYGHRNISELN